MGWAQFIFQKAIGTGNAGESSSHMIALRSGGYLLAGTRFSPYLARVDEQGDTLWTRDYQTSYSSADFDDQINPVGAYSVAENRSGQILVTCGGGRRRANGSWDAGGLLLLVDGATGNLVWAHTFQSPLTDGYNNVKLAHDGNFVLLGSQLGATYAMKMDSTGRILWSYLLPSVDSTASGPAWLEPVPGGYLILNKGIAPSPPYTPRDTLRFLSESGQLQRLSGLTTPIRPFRCQQDARGNLLFATGRLIKLNAQGDTIWSKTYRFGGTVVGIHAVAITPDSNYVALGQRQYQVQSDLVFLKIAPDGRLIRDTVLYRPIGSEYATDVLVDAQGNYVLYGWTSSGVFPVGFPDLVLLKYRGWRQTLSLAEGAAARDEFELFPNPATDRVTIRAPRPVRASVVLRDVLGRVLWCHSVAGTSTATCSLAAYPPGLYLLTLTDAEHPRPRTWRVVKQ